MRTPRSKPTKQTKPDPVKEFMKSDTGREFIRWWQNHRHSGYSTKGIQTRYGILPEFAVRTERYMAEFTGESEYYSPQEIAAMRAEQEKVEEATGELEARFGPKFWEKMTPAEWIGKVKLIVREIVGDLAKANQAKIDAAYAYEPGQSEEETALLSRRRSSE